MAHAVPWLWRASVLAIATLLASRYGSPYDAIRDVVYMGILFTLANLVDTEDDDFEPPPSDGFLDSLSKREAVAVVLIVLAGLGATIVMYMRLVNALPDPLNGTWPWWLGTPVALVVMGAGVWIGAVVAQTAISYRRRRPQ